MTFGPGSVAADTRVVVAAAGAATVPAGLQAVSPVYDLTAVDAATGAAVHTFGAAPVLTVKYDPAVTAPPTIYYLDPSGMPVALMTTVDVATHTVWAPLPHFSPFVAAVVSASALNGRPPVVQATITGSVTDTGGGAIAGATLTASSQDGFRVHGATDAAGAFSLGVSRGQWTISLDRVAGYNDADPVSRDTTAVTIAPVAFALTALPITVSGKVRDANGNPLAGIHVTGGPSETFTAADGSYSLKGNAGWWYVHTDDVAGYYPLSIEANYVAGRHQVQQSFGASATNIDLVLTPMPRAASGKITLGDGATPAPGIAVQVNVASDHGWFQTWVATAADGTYSLRTPTDVYAIDVYPQWDPVGYTDRSAYYGSWQRQPGDSGAAIELPSFTYRKLTVPVAGTVRTSTGDALSGVTVYGEWYLNGWHSSQTTTGADGTYRLLGDAGNWNVYAQTWIDGYTRPNNVSNLAISDSGTSNLDFTYVAAAAVVGTLTRADTGAAQPYAYVRICGLQCVYSQTNSLGEYEGWLYVSADTSSGTATATASNGIIGLARPSQTLTATSGAVVTANLVYAPFTALASGTAVDSFGTPIAGAKLHAYGYSTGDYNEAYTAADGSWSIAIPDGYDYVYGDGGQTFSQSQTIYIQADAGGTYAGNALVFPSALLVGHVYDPAGNPLSAPLEVCNYWYCADWSKIAVVNSAADGSYSVVVAAYNVTAIQPLAVRGYLAPANQYTYSPGAGNTVTLDFTYRAGAVIAGRVVDDGGTPIANANVVLDAGPYWQVVRGTTDANGVYVFTLDNASSTYHEVEPGATSGYTKAPSTYAGSWWDGSVQNGQTLNLPDLVLLRNGTVTGLVTDDTGAVVAGAKFTVSDRESWTHCVGPWAWYCDYGWEIAGTLTYDATSDATGHYSLSAPVGTESVHARKIDHYTTPPDSLPLTLGAAGVATADFVYPRRVLVTGQVTANSGILPGVAIRYEAYDPYNNWWSCDSDHYYCGSFTVAPGDSTYTLELPAGYADTWSLRLTKSGTSYTGAVSPDGVHWTTFGTATNSATSSLKIGLYAYGIDNATPVTVSFDYFRTTIADSASCPGSPASDEFAASTLDTCRWSIVRENTAGYRVVDGKLQIDTLRGDIWYSRADAQNLVLQAAPDGDWTIETRLRAPLDGGFAQAGLLVYADDDNYVKFDLVSDPWAGHVNRIEIRSETGGYVNCPCPDYYLGGAHATVVAQDNVPGYGNAQPRSQEYRDWQLVPGATLTGATFAYAAYAHVTGYVLDANGNPLPQAVRVYADSYGNGAYLYRETYTAADGSYTLDTLAGEAYVHIPDRLAGYGNGGDAASSTEWVHVYTTSTQTATAALLVYRAWVPLAGQLVADDGLPLPGAPFASGWARDQWNHYYYSDSWALRAPSGGGDASAVVPVGHLRIDYVSSFGRFLNPNPVEYDVPAGGLIVAPLVWTALATIQGSLRDGDGNPVGTPVRACDWCWWYVPRQVELRGPDPHATVSTWVYLDPAATPGEIMLHFYASDGGWEHRAYWGADLMTDWGTNGTPSRMRLGDLPAAGQWVRLDVPAVAVGIDNRDVWYIAFTTYNGRAWFDDVTLSSDTAATTTVVDDNPNWYAYNDPWWATGGWDDGSTSGVTPYSGTTEIRVDPVANGYHHWVQNVPTFHPQGPRRYFADIDWNGNYSKDVLPDAYSVIPPQVNPFGLPATQAVTVAARETKTANFLYSYVGTIRGAVNDDHGAAIAGVNVCDDLGNCAQTDSAGAYSFHAPTGDRVVHAPRFLLGYSVIDTQSVNLAIDATVTLNFTYVSNGVVTGTVRDDLGAPLAGATLSFTYRDPLSNAFLATYSATSGGDGSYTLSVPYGTGRSIEPQALAHYRAPAASAVDVVAGTPAALDFAYDRNGSIGGTVRDRQGNAVVGATLNLGGTARTATTAADGTYVFADVTPGTYTVLPVALAPYAVAAAAQATAPVGSTGTLDFTYVKRAKLTGHVQDDGGAALVGATIYIWGGPSTQFVSTDAGGDFVAYLDAATYNLNPQSYSGGFGAYLVPAVQSVVAIEATPLSPSSPFVYTRMARLHVVVVDQASNALPGATIQAFENGVFVGSATSGFDGAFGGRNGVAVLVVPAAAQIVLRAIARSSYDPPLAPADALTLAANPGDELLVSPGFQYVHWGKVEGTVLDQASNPVANLTVTATPGGGSALTNSSGVFRIDAPRGSVTVRAQGAGYTPATATVTVASGGTTNVTLNVTQFGTVSGDVRDRNGVLLGVAVTVQLVINGAVVDARVTDANGRYTLSGAPGDAFVRGVVANGWDQPVADTPVTLLAAKTTAAPTLTYLVWGHVAGRITDATGIGVAGLTVRVDTGQFAVTDVNGNYSIAAPRGTRSVTVDRRDGYVTPTVPTPTAVASETTSTVNLAAQAYVARSGRVLDAFDHAVVDAAGNPPTLSAIDGFANRWVNAIYAANGIDFTFTLPAGAFTIYASGLAGYTAPAPRLVAAGTGSIGDPIRYQQDGTLNVALADDTGPLANVGVTIVSQTTGARYTPATGVDGKLSLRLPVGTYNVTPGVVSLEVTPAPANGVLAPGGTADFAFTYRRFGELKGFVKDDGGAPVANVDVVASLGAGSTFTVKTNLDGSFSIRGPPTDAFGQAYVLFLLPVAHYALPGQTAPLHLGAYNEANGIVDVGTLTITRYARITGTVTDDHGALAGVTVKAQQAASTVDSTISAADGTYTLWVPRGTGYRVFGGDVANHLTPTTNPAPAAPAIDLAAGGLASGVDLFYKAYKEITGFVRDNGGVGLYSSDPNRGPFVAFSGDAPVAGADVLHINKRFKTNPDGSYSALLPNGNYLVVAQPLPGYVAEDVRQLQVDDVGCWVGIGHGTPISCSSYDWTYHHGVVAGHTIDDAGNPVAHATIQLKGVDYQTTVTSDDSGAFTIGAPPADYGLIAQPLAGYTTPIGATIVTLPDSATPASASIVYKRNATVTGRAVDPISGNGLAGVVFVARNTPDGGTDSATATTDVDGYFTLSAPAGKIVVFPGNVPGYELPQNVSAEVAAGGAKDLGVLAYISALVSGFVRDSFGAGLSNVGISAQDARGFYVDAVTTADGSFSLHVHTGTSFLFFSDRIGYAKPAPLTLANLTAGIDPTTRVAVYGNARVTGTVVSAGICTPLCTGGGPVDGATVAATQNGATVALATTAADGTYTLGVPLGDVTVLVAPLAGYTAPTPVALTGLTAGSTRSANFTYSVDGHVTGTAADDLGNPLAGVKILIGSRQATTGADGSFDLTAPSGPGVTFTVTPGNADGYTRPAPITGQHVDSGATLVLALTYGRNGELRGRAVDSAGNGLGGVFVVATGATGQRTYTTTADDGTFALSAPAGTDDVRALDFGGYRTPPAQTVTVGSGATTIGLVFEYGNAILTGRAVDDVGNPVANAAVLIEGALGSIVHTRDDGTFTANAAPGNVSVRAGTVAGLARPVPWAGTGLVVGETYEVPTFVYTHLGSISGVVVDLLGRPLANVKVFVSAPNNNFTVVSGADGSWVSSAAPGANVVRGNGLFGYQTPGDQTISVLAGLDTGGIVLTYGMGVVRGHVADGTGTDAHGLADVLVTSTGAFVSSTRTDANGDYVLGVGLGDNTIAVEDLDGRTAPDSRALPFIGAPAEVAGVDFAYQTYSTVAGSVLRLLVEDVDTRAPVSGVSVVISLAGDQQVKKTTGADGTVKFRIDPGDYVSYVFKDGYRPLTQQVTAGVGAGEQLALIKQQQFVVGEVTVKRLTLSEILAAGININDPANQNIYVFTAKIVFDLTLPAVAINATFNGADQPVDLGDGGPAGGGGGGGGCSADFGCGFDGPDHSRIYVKPLPGPPDKKPFAYFLIPGTAKFLKEFFQIHFHVVNTADPEWVLEDTVATLAHMDGLPLAATAKPQSESVNLGSIAGGKEASVDWIVRGDTKGDYSPTVTLTSTLQPVNEAIDVVFRSRDPIHVFGEDAIKMTFDVPPSAIAPFPIQCPMQLPNPDPACDSIAKWAPDAARPGELERSAVPFIVRIGLQNTTDVPVYKASVTLFDLDPSGLGVKEADRMFKSGIGVVGDSHGNLAQRPLLMGFGEKLEYDWLQIDPHQTVWATWILIPPFGAPVKVEESSVTHTGGNADFHATVQIDPSLAQGISNQDLGVITRGLGDLTIDGAPGGVTLTWSAVRGARAYRIYRTQDRYDWSRETSFLAEVDASTLSFLDTSTTGTPGEPEAYFYAIETVFGPSAVNAGGESHVLHPVTPWVDVNGLFARSALLRASALATATVSIDGPGGLHVDGVSAGNGLQVATLSGAALVAGEYTVTMTAAVQDTVQLTVSGQGAFDDPGHWGHAFEPHMDSLVATLAPGEQRSFKVLFDPTIGVRRIWLVGSAAPRVDAASLPAAELGVVTAQSAYGDSPHTLTIAGAGLGATTKLYLDGTTQLATTATTGGVAAAIPYGLSAGWHDLLAVNDDGSFGWFYGAVRGIDAFDISYDRSSTAMPRFVGVDPSFALLTRNAGADTLTYRLDNAPAQAVAGSTLTLTGLRPGFHYLTLELGAVRRPVPFQVLPARFDANGAPLSWPAPDAGILTWSNPREVVVDPAVFAPGTRVTVALDGRDGVITTVPVDGKIAVALGNSISLGLHDGTVSGGGLVAHAAVFVRGTADRTIVPPQGQSILAAPGQAIDVPFRIVRSNDLPAYHFPAPVGGISLDSLPPDTLAVALDGAALAPAAFRYDGSGILSLTAPQAGDHTLAFGSAYRVLTVTNDVDADGLVNSFDPDTDGDGILNADDADMNGDGVPNGSDPDVDGDTIPNTEDVDIDGDGIVNAVVECRSDGTSCDTPVDPDIDGDGIPNELDTDIDGDGVANADDPTPYGPTSGHGVLTQNRFERHDAHEVRLDVSHTVVSSQVLPGEAAPNDLVTYTITLTGDGGATLANRFVYIVVTDPSAGLVGATYPMLTDGNGRAVVTFHPIFGQTDWQVQVHYDGDWWYAPAEYHDVLSVHDASQPALHVLPGQDPAGPYTVDFTEQSDWAITGSGWSGDGSVGVTIECVTGCAPATVSRLVAPGDLASLSGFVHDVVAARGTPDVVGIWRATAVGSDTGRAYSLLFQVFLAPPPPPVCKPIFSASTPDLVASDDSGRFADDDYTNVIRPTFLVIVRPLLLVQLLEGADVIGQGYADDAGSALVQVDEYHPFADGVHHVSARAVGDDGTPGVPSPELAVTVDTVAPDMPAIDLPAAEDSGFFSDDHITNVATLHPFGTAELGSTIEWSDLFGLLAGGSADTVDGSFALTLDALGDGLYLVAAHAVDLAGNAGWDNYLVLLVDTTAPGMPTLALTPDEDTGASQADGITKLTTLHFGGAPATTEPYAMVFLHDSTGDGAYDAGTTADDSGFWGVEESGLTDGLHSFSAIAYDLAGNASASSSLDVSIDTVAPTIASARDRAPNANDWYGDDVLVTFTCSDDTALASCTDPTTVGEGGMQVVSGTATDVAGNSATAAEGPINVDKTRPVIVAHRSVAPNAYGWNNTDVTVDFECSDALSGIAGCSAPVTLTDEGAFQSATGAAVDLAGNAATVVEAPINIDKTAPTLQATRSVAPNAAGWNNVDVTVSYSCADVLSGVAECAAPQTFGEGAGQTASATIVDEAGNAASVSLTLNVDETAPTIVAHRSVAPNGYGWNNTDVTVSFECADALSGLGGCSGAVLFGEGAGQSATGLAVDQAGNVAVVTESGINVDETAPVVSAARSVAPNGNGWNNTPVAVTFSCSDGLSGLTAGCAAAQVFGEGANQSASLTVTDLAGNSATASVSNIDVDLTAPTVVAHRSVAPNGYGWNNTDVTVSFDCGDALSGIASCTGPQTFGEGANQSATGTVTDLAGNVATVTEAKIDVDETAPGISATRTPAPNANGWNNTPVTVVFSCGDALAGLVAGCAAAQVFGEGANQSASLTVTDLAGNSATASVSNIDVDLTPPIVSVPGDILAEATSAAGAVVNFTVGATDALSGSATFTVSTPSGSTFAIATTAVTVTATDGAGNQTTRSFTVTVADTTAPTGTVTINGGATTTGTPNVTVALDFVDAVGVTEMQFSTDGGRSWSSYVPYAPTANVTLPGGDGTKTVTVRVRDAAHNDVTASDTIVLSTAPPQITIGGVASGQTCDVCATFAFSYRVTTIFGYTASATLDGKPIANGGSVDVFFLAPGAHTLVVTATDEWGKTSKTTLTFEVHATLEGLACAVNRGVKLGVVAAEQQQPLLAKLNAASASRDRGNRTSETNQLQALIHDLQAQRGKKIDAAFVDRMIAWTNDLIARIAAHTDTTGTARALTAARATRKEH